MQSGNNGQFKQSDFFNNVGGLNFADSVFRVGENQAVDGYNYTYTETGSIQKRLGHALINAVANSDLRSLGLSINNSAQGDRFNVRAAGTHLQSVNLTSSTFTNLTDDTSSAEDDILESGTTQPVVWSQFNTPDSSVVWAAGGGMNLIYGIYSDTKATQNGVPAPTGALSTQLNSSPIILQDITFTADAGLPKSAVVTITYTNSTTAGSEFVIVSGFNIAVGIQSGVSTATQINTALNASIPAQALISQTISGTGSNAQTTTGTPIRLAREGAFLATGVYRYAVVFRKASTKAYGNASLDVTATVAATTNTVVINFSGITNNDTTRYDLFYIYRSAVGGAAGFTTGDLIGIVPSSVTTFVDTGDYLATAQNIPRSGNIILDNTPLSVGGFASVVIQDLTYTAVTSGPAGALITITYTSVGAVAGSEVVTVAGTNITVSMQSGVSTAAQIAKAVTSSNAASLLVGVVISGLFSNAQTPQALTSLVAADPNVYNVLTTFKRRLVTAYGSTVGISDINKPESFPLTNYFTVPSGGNITALAIISYTSTNSNTIDEILVIFKEREIWVLQGDSFEDYILKFIDSTGCATQPLVVTANGYLSWIDYRGVYLWDGTGKPVYVSRPIEPLFARDGNLDKAKLYLGHGQFYRKDNIIIWYVSDKLHGEQRLQIKLDVRLTLPTIQTNLMGRISDGVFIFDNTAFPIYSALSFLPAQSNEEDLLLGDGSGFLYKAYKLYADDGDAYSFTYVTPSYPMGNPAMDKRFNYVVVWVTDIGTWNLTLDWWTNYNSSPSLRSTRALPISTEDQTNVALWDIARWDVALWDDGNTKSVPLFFQLSSDANNNSEGKAIKLQFRQESANEPITILGYSILYTDKGVQK